MTRNEATFGCLSKSLKKFLSCKNDEERKKKYGSVKAAKYYERIVKSVNGSFQDHRLVFLKLPKEHSKKINFKYEYDNMLSLAAGKKWFEGLPDKRREETIVNLNEIRKTIKKNQLHEEFAGDPFDKVIKYLNLIKLEEENPGK